MVKPQQARPAWETRAYLYGTLASVATAYGLFSLGLPTLIYDSFSYHFLANISRERGLFAWPAWAADLRTYGYPLFLCFATGWQDLSPEVTRLVVFHVQLALYILACAFVARSLGKLFRSSRVRVAAYLLTVLNPLVLLHTTEVLTDLLSSVLVLLAVALAWKLPDRGAPSRARAFLSFLCAASATMVRPSNVSVVAALGLVWVLRHLLWRDVTPRAIAAMLAGLVLPFLPQMAMNAVVFGRPHPLIVNSLYSEQMQWGMGGLKYGTVVIGGQSPFLDYPSPLFHWEKSPWAFLRAHPLRYVATLALHGFAMLDHDFPFTYITDLRPWYRWPLSVLNYLWLWAALLGLAAALARCGRQRRLDPIDFGLAASGIIAAAYIALHLPILVENRFGLPVDLLAVPFIVSGGVSARRSLQGAHAGRALAALALSAAAFVGACVVLSTWVSRQSQRLQHPELAAGQGVQPPPHPRTPTVNAPPR